MRLAEALTHVNAGKRVTCSALPKGAVLKLEPGHEFVRQVWEATGDGFDFRTETNPKAELADDWRLVEGWAVYA